MNDNILNPATTYVTSEEFTKYGDVTYEEWLILYAQEHGYDLITDDPLPQEPVCRSGACG